MPPINQAGMSPETLEFRGLCNRLNWTAAAFAKAAKIKPRSARLMWSGTQRPAPGLMDWLREMAANVDKVPAPPGE